MWKYFINPYRRNVSKRQNKKKWMNKICKSSKINIKTVNNIRIIDKYNNIYDTYKVWRTNLRKLKGTPLTAKSG